MEAKGERNKKKMACMQTCTRQGRRAKGQRFSPENGDVPD